MAHLIFIVFRLAIGILVGVDEASARHGDDAEPGAIADSVEGPEVFLLQLNAHQHFAEEQKAGRLSLYPGQVGLGYFPSVLNLIADGLAQLKVFAVAGKDGPQVG